MMAQTASTSSTTASAGDLGRRGENLSILIPTYNCAEYLRETLKSLRAQGGVLDEAEIEIVDDCSTKDDPEAAAREVWGDRVSFYRHAKNLGPIGNFNACLERAHRPWIHILHGDDVVMPGAYVEFSKGVQALPDTLAVFAQSIFMDEKGIWNGITPPLGPDWVGRYRYRPFEWRVNPVQFAGVLISQEAVKCVGGFDPRFIHVADYNLWWRLAKTGRVAYVNKGIAGHRMFEGNHSSSLMRSGRNIAESIEQAKLVFADFTSSTEPRGIAETPREFWVARVHEVVLQSRNFLDDADSYHKNVAVLKSLPAGVVQRRLFWRLRLERLKRILSADKR
jgi:GT2 family glycosyltransferase